MGSVQLASGQNMELALAQRAGTFLENHWPKEHNSVDSAYRK